MSENPSSIRNMLKSTLSTVDRSIKTLRGIPHAPIQVPEVPPRSLKELEIEGLVNAMKLSRAENINKLMEIEDKIANIQLESAEHYNSKVNAEKNALQAEMDALNEEIKIIDGKIQTAKIDQEKAAKARKVWTF